MPTDANVRKRLEEQGFTGLGDDVLAEVAPWLRWAPVLCTFFMILGLALKSPLVLWLLACTAFMGAFLPFHPFDLLFNYGFRYLFGVRPLPHQGPQRRFACAIATAWLFATGWAFYVGADMVGYALGIPLVLVAALVSVTHICIPSIIYNWFHRAGT
jgi:hypothetical protein